MTLHGSTCPFPDWATSETKRYQATRLLKSNLLTWSSLVRQEHPFARMGRARQNQNGDNLARRLGLPGKSYARLSPCQAIIGNQDLGQVKLLSSVINFQLVCLCEQPVFYDSLSLKKTLQLISLWSELHTKRVLLSPGEFLSNFLLKFAKKTFLTQSSNFKIAFFLKKNPLVQPQVLRPPLGLRPVACTINVLQL